MMDSSSSSSPSQSIESFVSEILRDEISKHQCIPVSEDASISSNSSTDSSSSYDLVSVASSQVLSETFQFYSSSSTFGSAKSTTTTSTSNKNKSRPTTKTARNYAGVEEKRTTLITKQRNQLLLLKHAATCKFDCVAQNMPCPHSSHCAFGKKLLRHMQQCKISTRHPSSCSFKYCRSSKILLIHHAKCTDLSCKICVVKKAKSTMRKKKTDRRMKEKKEVKMMNKNKKVVFMTNNEKSDETVEGEQETTSNVQVSSEEEKNSDMCMDMDES